MATTGSTYDQENAKVNTPSIAQAEMEASWELIDDLLGGTEAIREKGTTWLPMEPKEKDANYRTRRDRSFLHPALEDTIEKLTAKPFEQAVTTKTDELPELLQPIVEDVDLEGTSLTEFARQAFKMAATKGLVHCLVETPSNPERKADPRFRPYFVLVGPDDLLGGDYWKDPYGQSHLIRVRTRRTRTEVLQNGYGQRTVEGVQVYGASDIEMWEIPEGGEEYALTDEPVPHTYNSSTPLGGGVPFATLYFDKAGRLQAKVPMRKLAWANLEHWQKGSDLSNIVRFASIGTLLLKGITEDEKADGIVWGPTNYITSASDTADGKILEHSGKAVATIEDHVRRIEERMEILGLEPYMRKTGSETATGKAMHGSKSDSLIKQWIRAEERWLVQLFNIAASWLDTASGGASSVEIPEGWKPKIYDDFRIPIHAGSEDSDRLLKARQAREISHETYIEENKRRGFLSEEVTSEDEQERLESEPASGPPAMEFMSGGEGPDDDEGAEGAA